MSWWQASLACMSMASRIGLAEPAAAGWKQLPAKRSAGTRNHLDIAGARTHVYVEPSTATTPEGRSKKPMMRT
jgi:hypothetical protein